MTRYVLALVAAGLLAAGAAARAAPATTLACPADNGAGDPGVADPWLLTNDFALYPELRAADANGDGYACVRDPWLITSTTVVRDDTPGAADPSNAGFRLYTLAEVRALDNPRLLAEAAAADRNENDEVLVAFEHGDVRLPLQITDNLWPDRRG